MVLIETNSIIKNLPLRVGQAVAWRSGNHREYQNCSFALIAAIEGAEALLSAIPACPPPDCTRAPLAELCYAPIPGGYWWALDSTMQAWGRAWLAGRERRQQWNEYARLCPDGHLFQQQEAFMIYALCEPDTGEIRYIGITKNAKERLNDHAREQVSTRRAWLDSLRQQGYKPTIKRLALVEGPRCFAEQYERAWIRVLFAHGCDLLNKEALDGPLTLVFNKIRGSFALTGNMGAWEEHTSLYLPDGIPSALPDDLRWNVHKSLEFRAGKWAYANYSPAEYATFRYESTLQRDNTGAWWAPPRIKRGET